MANYRRSVHANPIAPPPPPAGSRPALAVNTGAVAQPPLAHHASMVDVGRAVEDVHLPARSLSDSLPTARALADAVPGPSTKAESRAYPVSPATFGFSAEWDCLNRWTPSLEAEEDHDCVQLLPMSVRFVLLDGRCFTDGPFSSILDFPVNFLQPENSNATVHVQGADNARSGRTPASTARRSGGALGAPRRQTS